MRTFKVMVDECMTKGCALVIIEYLKLCDPPVEAHFLVTYLGTQGSLDGDWTKLLSPPSDWIVLTCDAGRSAPREHLKGPPLHLILPQRGIIGFFFRGKRFNHVPGEERARNVIAAMPKVLAAAEAATPGERFVVKRTDGGATVTPWPLSGPSNQ